MTPQHVDDLIAIERALRDMRVRRTDFIDMSIIQNRIDALLPQLIAVRRDIAQDVLRSCAFDAPRPPPPGTLTYVPPAGPTLPRWMVWFVIVTLLAITTFAWLHGHD